MTLISKLMLVLFAAFLFLTEGSFAAMDSNAFEVVPTGDPTYGQLQQLENGGLLPSGASQGPLTRFDVAQKIWDAQQKLKEIVVAQADMDLVPPPPAEGVPAPAASTSPADSTAAEPPAAAPPAATQAAAAQPTPADDQPLWNNPQKIQAAEQALQSLQATYDLELQLVKDQKTDLTDQLSLAESDQYGLWKMVKSIDTNPSVSIHGTGRAIGISQQYYGSYTGISLSNPSTRDFDGYLDLEPTGAISKEITFDGVIRLGTYALPDSTTTAATGGLSSDYLELRRVTANFSPDFMTATVGDFSSPTRLSLFGTETILIWFMCLKRWAAGMRYKNTKAFLTMNPIGL
ncbi:MAG TPA: hypothetical protein VN963_01725 [bacterium]|nr:hypothetical protein [bacterium]